MRKIVLLAIAVVICAFIVPSGHCESLTILNEYSHEVGRINSSHGTKLSALLLGGDSVMFISELGLYARFDKSQDWRQLIACVPWMEDVPFSICRKKELNQLIMPDGLWRISGKHGDEVLTREGFCGQLYSLQFRDENRYYMKKWRKKKGKGRFGHVNIQNDLILCGLNRFSSDRAVTLQYTDKSDYSRVFEYPETLTQRFDSLGWSSGNAFCIPAFNPKDSTLWLAVNAYDYIYITDMKGRLLDSLHISAPDYHLPPPLKSRIKSNAVMTEWLSHWTPVSSFVYVCPGYFLMQYFLGREVHGETKVSLYSTIAWDIEGQPIALDVEKQWRLAGVQPDGRIIFGHYEFEDSICKVVLNVVRIEP